MRKTVFWNGFSNDLGLIVLSRYSSVKWVAPRAVDNAEHYLQMFGGRRCLASPDLLGHAVAAQPAALLGRLVLPEIVHFMLSKILLTIRKSDTHDRADIKVVAAFRAKHVSQESFNSVVHGLIAPRR
jgi:hypothetical protein